MTKIERIRAALPPGTRLIVESNTANALTVGRLRTVLAVGSSSFHYEADERPGERQVGTWSRPGERVDFDGERLAVTHPKQGREAAVTVYRIA